MAAGAAATAARRQQRQWQWRSVAVATAGAAAAENATGRATAQTMAGANGIGSKQGANDDNEYPNTSQQIDGTRASVSFFFLSAPPKGAWVLVG